MDYPIGLKPQEIPAYEYLFGLGLGKIVYEPCGPKTAPDFSVGDSLAVETTLLFQSITNAGSVITIDERYKSILDSLMSVLQGFDLYFSGKTYAICMNYSAVLKRLSPEIKREFNQRLASFLRAPNISSSFDLGNLIHVSIFETDPQSGKVFVFGASDCTEQYSEPGTYAREINRCIELKSEKTFLCINPRSSWWLILVDSMGYGINQREYEEINSKVTNLGVFSRVILIDNKCKLLIDIP